jgi:hypothetical protein
VPTVEFIEIFVDLGIIVNVRQVCEVYKISYSVFKQISKKEVNNCADYKCLHLLNKSKTVYLFVQILEPKGPGLEKRYF